MLFARIREAALNDGVDGARTLPSRVPEPYLYPPLEGTRTLPVPSPRGYPNPTRTLPSSGGAAPSPERSPEASLTPRSQGVRLLERLQQRVLEVINVEYALKRAQQVSRTAAAPCRRLESTPPPG